MPSTAKSYQDRTQLKCRCSVVSLVRPWVRSGQRCDGGVLQLALALGGRVGEPVVTERVRHDVGRHHALDVVHQKERSSQHVAGGLDPAHPRDGNVGQLSDQPDHFELVVKPIRREHRHVLGGRRHPRHQLLLDRSPVLLPPRGQDDGFRRHAGGVHATFHGHLGCRPTGQHARQPARYHRRQGGHVAARALESVDGSDCRFVGHKRLPGAAITLL